LQAQAILLLYQSCAPTIESTSCRIVQLRFNAMFLLGMLLAAQGC